MGQIFINNFSCSDELKKKNYPTKEEKNESRDEIIIRDKNREEEERRNVIPNYLFPSSVNG